MNFLVSGLGGDIAQSIVKILRAEFAGSHVVGLDVTRRNAASLYCDTLVLVPKASESEFLPFLEKLIVEKKIDFFIPCTEFELRVLKNVLDKPPFAGRVISCGSFILETCLDKLTTYKFLQEKGVSVPWFATDVSEVAGHLPCIYKKRSGSGAKDLFFVKTVEEATFFTKYSPNGLFQELLEGAEQEVTCAVFRWGNEHFECIQLLRELKDGTTSWARKIEDKNILEYCRKISDILNLSGSMNIQLRLTDKGPQILEINPRFSSTVYMRHLMGFKDLVWTLNKAQGETLDLQAIKISEREIVRTFDAEFLK